MSAILEAVREAYELAPSALRGGLLVAGACAAFGVFLRWRRLVWAGFAVPEAATVGTAAALGLGTLLPALGWGSVSEAWLAGHETTCVLLTSAVAIAWLVPVGRAARRGGERAAAACFIVAATLTVLLVSRSPHGTEEVRALATGKSLLFLAPDDVALLLWTLAPLTLLGLFFTAPLAAVAFDRDHARVAGHRVLALEAGFAAGLLALMTIVAPRAGAPLVFAYLTLPPAAAERIVARPLPTVLVSIVLGTAAFLVGATASVDYDLPFSTAAAGGAVVVALVAAAGAAIARTLWRAGHAWRRASGRVGRGRTA